ncbi:unnamed protein product [Calypogeia fissa]
MEKESSLLPAVLSGTFVHGGANIIIEQRKMAPKAAFDIKVLPVLALDLLPTSSINTCRTPPCSKNRIEDQLERPAKFVKMTECSHNCCRAVAQRGSNYCVTHIRHFRCLRINFGDTYTCDNRGCPRSHTYLQPGSTANHAHACSKCRRTNCPRKHRCK